jgi:hypothetical protein
MGTWKDGSPSFEPSLLKRLIGVQQFIVPSCLFVFGICVMFIGLTTIIYDGTQETNGHE